MHRGSPPKYDPAFISQLDGAFLRPTELLGAAGTCRELRGQGTHSEGSETSGGGL